MFSFKNTFKYEIFFYFLECLNANPLTLVRKKNMAYGTFKINGSYKKHVQSHLNLNVFIQPNLTIAVFDI